MLHNKSNQNRFIWGMVGLFVVALMLPVTGLLKAVFFPGDDFDYLYIDVEKPQGTALAATDLSMREVEEVLYTNKDIASFVSQTGAGSAFASGDFSGPGSGSAIGNFTVNLPKGHKKTSAQMVSELRDELKVITSAKVTVGEPAGGPPSSAPVTITFSGNDLDALTTTAENASHALAEIPGVINIESSTKNAAAEFVVTLDSGKAVELGVSPVTVASTLRTALFSEKATSIRSGKDDIEIHTKLDLNPNYTDPAETTHTSIDAVRALTVQGTKGPIPLSTIANITYEPTQTSIRHEAGVRISTVTADVDAHTNAIEVTNLFGKQFTPDKLGKGVTMKLGGASQDVGQSFTELFIALLAGAALMLSILILEFNSFRHSLYLLSIIPLSLVGVYSGQAVVPSPLSLPPLVGIYALAGLSLKQAIILMDSIARIHREHPEMSLENVVVEAGSTRLRPILLTTIVTVVGMLPLAFASPFWAPLAFAIMFGLAFSLLLTLVLIPTLYYRWPGKDIREHYARIESPLPPPTTPSSW